MPADKYKFISPGVFIHEIDNTGLTATAEDIGPVLIGRAEKGPILKPITVSSYADFVNTFGNPVPGGQGGDISRDGNYTAPTYAPYAAQAWFRNNPTVTYVRLGGQEHVDASPGGQAGWRTHVLTASPDPTVGGPAIPAANGGAWGLFVADSASFNLGATVTGTLAAVWYLDQDLLIGLSGTFISGTTPGLDGPETKGTSLMIKSVGFQQFKVVLSGAQGTLVDTKFDFTPTSDIFIRKVFNTNPGLTNNNVTTDVTSYWLGESYEGAVRNQLTASSHIGVILKLRDSLGNQGGNFQKDYSNAQSGWFFAQDLNVGASATGSYDPSQMQTLFKVIARNSGDWAARNLKVSIQDLKRSSNVFDKYGSFTVALRKIDDTDNRVEYVEQFNNCTLNPNSENFIGRKIGDRHVVWDDENRNYREYGDYPNMSQYIRVEINESVKKGDTEAEFLPFGVRGPLIFNSFDDRTSNTNPTFVSGNIDDTGLHRVSTFISGATGGNGIGVNAASCSFEFPKLRLRISGSEGDPTDPRNVFFGVDTTFGNGSRFDESVLDHLKIKPVGITVPGAPDVTIPGTSSISYFFTLDDMCNTSTNLTGTNVYLSGSRATDKTSGDLLGDLTYDRGTGSYVRVLEDAGVTRFTTVFFGGFDGLNVKEAEPFRNSLLDAATGPKTSYAFNSIQVAIDSLRDPEVVDYNLAAMPGIQNNTLNRTLIDMCEQRGDALAVIDLKDDYTSEYESTNSAASRLPNVDLAILNLRNNLAVNSSYGVAYFPWVQIRDLITGQFVWIPPSVAAIGAMSYGQKSSELWFAPAGFTRGGLSSGNAGIPVVGVRKRLTSKERDKLYDANINPIAQFPAEGIVIFGQKTLQATHSALDRINVRRLLIFLKRRISAFASTLLFDQNVRTTWNRFRGVVEPFLASVQARLGITNFKMVLDETTTTPDLIDRNILYAKIYIKPARSIEFIAIDFILTDSGAAFED